MARSLAVCLALLLSVACAARDRPSARLGADLVAADEVMHAGCYTCLRDALARYEALAKTRGAPADLPQRIFEAAVLLTLRAKEIGLPFEPWLERARAAAPSLPATSGAAAVVELIELAPMEMSGFAPGPAGLRRFAREVLPALAAWRERIDATTLTPTTKRYLDLAVACEDRTTRMDMASEAPPTDAPPIVRYRRAICNPTPEADAGRLLAEDPRWTEAAWFAGRRMLAVRGELTEAIDMLAVASRAFPESGAMLMSLAGTQRAADRLDAALASYDAVLALVPEHRWALLGRVLCLTYLGRHADAVASATRMIDLGTHLIGDAYYWRAWNRYQLKALDEAWADATSALTQQANTTVHTLTGLIAYARKELPTALSHFERAWTLDNSNCDAGWYKGIVQAELNAWRDAAPTFSTAMSCFVAAASTARAELASVQASSQTESQKAKRQAELQKSAEENERKAATAAYNAAQGFGRTGQTGPALTHLEVAAGHEAMREKAEALKKLLVR